QAIGKQWLVANRHSIGLQEEQSPPDELWVDVAHFQQNLAAASLLPPPQKWPLLAETAALYRGRFLQGFTLADSRAFDDWQLWQSEQLSAQANALYDELVRSYRQQGALKTAVRYARQWVALEPWHEPAQRQLILSLALAGERAAALQQYQTCQRLLAEELGVAPQAETVALFEQIR